MSTSSARQYVVRAGVLDVAVEEYGPEAGPAVVLLHGFPYDPRAYDEVAVILVDQGMRVIVPYLRGYGHTKFVNAETPRSGQQAALAHDLRHLILALKLEAPIVGGFDWGGRAACLVAALWSNLVSGLVTVEGFNVQHIPSANEPASPEIEKELWYQYYFHSERGRAGLAENRRAIANLLWKTWSPNWDFPQSTFDATAGSFNNPDFVEVVIHSYRHRYGLVEDDPAYTATEKQIVELKSIGVPTVILDPAKDGLRPPAGLKVHQTRFTQIVDYQSLPVGHNLPQQAPAAFAEAVLKLRTHQQ